MIGANLYNCWTKLRKDLLVLERVGALPEIPSGAAIFKEFTGVEMPWQKENEHLFQFPKSKCVKQVATHNCGGKPWS